MREKLIHRLLRGAVVVLAVLGLAAILLRGYRVIDTLALKPESRNWLRPEDRLFLDEMAEIAGIKQGSLKYKQAEADIIAFNNSFVNHPLYTFLHLAPASLLMMLGPLQFSNRIRNRYPLYHRWSGRLLLLSVLPLGLSSCFFGLLLPFGGNWEAAAVAIFGFVFVLSAVQGFIAIRRKDLVGHREWMIRMFAVAIGVSVIRIVDLALALLIQIRPRELFAPSLWIGWLLALLFAELWLRRTRKLTSVQSKPTLSDSRLIKEVTI